MLWDVSKLVGYSIEAYDGQLGTVSDLLFDDQRWTLRWIVVDNDTELPGRKILLPIPALGHPDPASRSFPVRLTMQQVRDSPEDNTDLPVSRQMEARIIDYYAMHPYWGGAGAPRSNAMATPVVVAPRHVVESEARVQAGAEVPFNAGDAHLRSVGVVTGYNINAIDGQIGHIEDFIVDDADWRIRYLKVETKNWWPGERVLISPRSVHKIEWADRLVHLDVTRQRVKDSPRYDPLITVDGAYDESFLTYYGIRWVGR